MAIKSSPDIRASYNLPLPYLEINESMYRKKGCYIHNKLSVAALW